MTISVVISVYNESAMIEECLRSLTRQLRPADEILLVDNNCSDDTIKKARQFPVRVITEPKQGIWAARATGFSAARSDIIVCTDADARFAPTWLADIEKQFLDKAVAGVCGPGKFYDGNRLANQLADWVYMKPYFFFVGLALGTKPLFGSNFAVRASIWRCVKDSVHSHTESVFDDIDLSYHIVSLGTIRYDKNLANFISIRPLKQPLKMLKRYRKGFRSVLIHWPQQAPWRRYTYLPRRP